MTSSQQVVLIHGTWCTGEALADARQAFADRGYTAHTPTLRYHDLPVAEGAPLVASLSIRDYVDDLVAFVESLAAPPLLVGHSLGGLLAQLVAARTPHAGVVAATPAPAAGIFGGYPDTVQVFGRFYLQPRPWAKPLWPASWKVYRAHVANTVTEAEGHQFHDDLVCDSGRVYWELLTAGVDRTSPCAVDFGAVTTPVLAIGGERDRMINPRVPRATAGKYRNGSYVEIPGSGHLVLNSGALPVTMARIDEWMARNDVLS